MIACATIDKDVEATQNLIDKLKDYELRTKNMPFRWTSSTVIVNPIKMNFHK